MATDAQTGIVTPQVKAFAATGILGAGFLDASLEQAMRWRPDFIGCDAGSTDGGPAYLATGRSMFGEASTRRDLRALLLASRHARIPLIIGSAGTGGADPHLDWTRDLLLDIAREHGLHFRLALIRAEPPREKLVRAWRAGRIRPLDPAPEADEQTLERSVHVVAMMGPEPIMRSLELGADVVLAGRASDTSIYAALPLMRGVDAGIAWHAAKILECGAACVTQRTAPDGLFAWLEPDAFRVEPPNPAYRCTPQSVASHALYENADPYMLYEPPGVLDLRDTRYEAASDRAVRVTGSRFRRSERYTLKLEGAELVGYQSLLMGGVRDPVILRQLDDWLARVEGEARRRIAGTFPDQAYTLGIRVYGRDGVMGRLEPRPAVTGHEVFLIFEVTAATDALSHEMANAVRHIALHHAVPEWHGLITALAHPHAPAVLSRGAVHRFNLNHLLETDDPLEWFPIEIVEVA